MIVFVILVCLIVLAAVLMCFIVLIQNSKGGGLAAGFASSNQIMGVRKTTDVLEKATWGLAIFINDSVMLKEAQKESQTNPQGIPGFDASRVNTTEQEQPAASQENATENAAQPENKAE